MTDSILLTVNNGLARITLNRPASLNSMGVEMSGRWRDIAHTITDDVSVGAVILDATGPGFCAGGDVFEMAAFTTGAQLTAMAHTIQDGIRTLTLSDKPIVAAVHGAVAGGGLGVMLTADYVIASDTARFTSKYASIGLTPDLGVSTLLPAAIGQRRALQLLLQDLTLDAKTAHDWGLVAEVLPGPSLAARAEEVARSWLEGATAAYGQARRLVRTGADRAFRDNLDDEAATIGAALDTDTARGRLLRFRDRRNT